MAIFGALFNLIPLFIIGFGLWVLVKKETMEINQDDPEVAKQGERANPAFHLFLYLTSFVSMGFLIGGMLTTLFQFVNKFVPDTAYAQEFEIISTFDDGALKVGISMLFIAGLVYFTVARLINQKLQQGDIRPESVVRKFITYIALFVLVATSIGSLATLFYQYLSGNLTGNSFGKIIAFFAVNGYFAYFYFWEVRRKDFTDKKFDYFYYAALAIAVLAFVFGLFIGDSPRVTRDKKTDASLVMEVQNMNSRVEIFYANNKRLPKADEIEQSAKFQIAYTAETDKNYQLCAEFLQSKESVNFYDKQWNHPAGKHCYKLNIDERQVKGGEIPFESFPEGVNAQ